MPKKFDQNKYERILKFLQKYFAQHGCAPTYDEIVTGAELSSKCLIRPYLEKLRADGMIRQEAGNPRALHLTDKGRTYPERPRQRVAAYVSKVARIYANEIKRMVRLPVVGRTFAGQTTPIPNADFATFDEFSTIAVSEDELPSSPKRDYYFVLEVCGDSMIEAGIFDGDYVICRKRETAQNGEMVVALLPDKNETTLKYFFRESNYIRLQPANPAMLPILIPDSEHLIIQGVVTRVVHCWN